MQGNPKVNVMLIETQRSMQGYKHSVPDTAQIKCDADEYSII